MLKVVSDAGVNIEYVYSLISTFVVLNVADVDRALELLRDQPVQLVSQEEIAQHLVQGVAGRKGKGVEDHEQHHAGT